MSATPVAPGIHLQASPTSQVSAKDRPQSSKNGQSTSHPANIGGCQWMRGLALKIQAPRLSAEAQTLLAVWWDLTRPPVHCVDGETLWQQHGEQRRRVEVLRSVHRTTRAVSGKKRLKFHPDVASWKSTILFCLLLFAA